MLRSLNLDETLIQELMAINNHANLETIIETSLREYIQRHQRLKVLDLFGAIDYDDTYNYKAQRQIPENERLTEKIRCDGTGRRFLQDQMLVN